jgi:glutaconate CoA-transferase subunit B
LFDFDADGHMRLRALYPDTSVNDVLENTEFTPRLAGEIGTIPVPDRPVVALIRRLDPLKVHEKEIRAGDIRREFALA